MLYDKNNITTLDGDWVTDFTMDFSNHFSVISSFVITSDPGITIVESEINPVTHNQIRIRITGGVKGSTYTVNCKVTSMTGEVRDMDLNLLIS